MFRKLCLCISCDIAVTLLSAESFPGRIAVMIRCTAVLPIVGMIGDQVGIDPILGQDLERRAVKRLQRSLTPVQEVVFPGMQFSSCRHTRKTSRIEPVKLYTMFLQPLEIRCIYPVISIVRQKLSRQCVKHDHDRSHLFCPFPA